MFETTASNAASGCVYNVRSVTGRTLCGAVSAQSSCGGRSTFSVPFFRGAGFCTGCACGRRRRIVRNRQNEFDQPSPLVRRERRQFQHLHEPEPFRCSVDQGASIKAGACRDFREALFPIAPDWIGRLLEHRSCSQHLCRDLVVVAAVVDRGEYIGLQRAVWRRRQPLGFSAARVRQPAGNGFVRGRQQFFLEGEVIQEAALADASALRNGVQANPKLDTYDFSSLRHVGGGGASMPSAVAQAMSGRLGVGYAEGYGLSETMGATHLCPPGGDRLQCLGIPLFDVDARIVDPDTCEAVAPGAVGEILVHAPQLMLGYWNSPAADDAAFVRIGNKRFFRTGDLASRDAQGFFVFADRLKRMINASGFKVWPAEVESKLYQHPAVQEACVIASGDARRGETVKALIVRRGMAAARRPRRLLPPRRALRLERPGLHARQRAHPRSRAPLPDQPLRADVRRDHRVVAGEGRPAVQQGDRLALPGEPGRLHHPQLHPRGARGRAAACCTRTAAPASRSARRRTACCRSASRAPSCWPRWRTTTTKAWRCATTRSRGWWPTWATRTS
jgi:acyl-CoA synthetase (AMP-forming)/AMP-acid ligase II